ncbi:plasmid mobilization relaxosome protein MobC [Streptomyces sp. BF23-18]|uniref:plasmid mobilization relaxosome protein MobC n=1 Tax=Streptomyces sp. BF23-18 TaxID=3240282 RepID=UPI0034E56FEE
MAGAPGSEGAPETKTSALRAADEAALHRVASRRARQKVQRTARVDVRYSVEEKREITAEARRLGLAGAHFVGAVLMAHLHGDHGLPGGRTPVDDLVDELAALRTQVARIGTNVNQIAHRLNAGGDPRPGDGGLLAEAGRILVLARQAATAIDATADMAASTGRSD